MAHLNHGMLRWSAQVIAAALLLLPTSASAEQPRPREMQGVDVEDRRGTVIDGDITFTDHTGKKVRLGDYFDGEKTPVLLTLNWYRCKTLCNTQLNQMLEAFKEMSWTAGEDGFRVVTVSIDEREGWELGQDKRKTYVDALGRGEIDWNFLVGERHAIDRLAKQVGFRFKYDARQDQYVHTTVIYVVTPQRKISRQLFGLAYNPRDLKFGLIDASDGAIGSGFDKVIMSCFYYDETLGSYAASAMGIMRLGGLLTLTVLGVFLAFWWRRERRRKPGQHEPSEASA